MANAVSLFKNVPMLADGPALIAGNPAYPSDRQSADVSLIKKVCRWMNGLAEPMYNLTLSPAPTPFTVPFTRTYLRQVFDKFTPALTGTSEKTIKNALSEINTIADLLGMPLGYVHVPLSEPCQKLQDKLQTGEDRGSCIRLLRVMSAHQIDPFHPHLAPDEIVTLLREHVYGDWRVKQKARECSRALYAWNKQVRTDPDWSQILLPIPKIRKVWGYKWSHFPSSLESQTKTAIGQAFQSDPMVDDIDAMFDEKPRKRLGASAQRNQSEAVRMFGSALVHSGIAIETLVDLGSVLLPDRFRHGLKILLRRPETIVTSVDRYARDAKTVAARSDLFTDKQLKQLDEICQKLVPKLEEFRDTRDDRDQDTLDTLDSPIAMDTYLTLGHREMQKVPEMGTEPTVGQSYSVVRALVHEIGLTVPLRIGRIISLRVDQFVKVIVNGEPKIMVRAPHNQTRTKRTPDAFLSPTAAKLLEVFLRKYRPILLRHNKAADSLYLFPGRNGAMKHPHTMRQMMNRFVRKSGLTDFHPHLIRKITPKIILDEDPTAMPVAVRSGGWADDTMIRRVYGQKNQRATQLKVNEFVEGRQLSAISTIKSKRRGGGSKAPKRGTGA